MSAERTSPAAGKLFERRRFLKLGAALPVAGFAALGGCGRSRDDENEVVFSAGPESTGVLRRQIARFNRENRDGIQVRWRVMPADVQQYLDQLRTEFQSGQSEIDVISGDVIWPAELASSGWISDLSDRFSENGRTSFFPSTIEANTYEGSVYGVPWFTDAGILYYRRDLLEESGYSEPPATWAELAEMSRRVSRDSGVENGFVFQGQNSEAGVVCGLEFIWNAGGDVLDGNEVVIDGPETVAGLEDERSLVADGISPAGVVNYAATESYIPFLGGNAVFLRSTPFIYGLIGDPDESNISPEQVGVAALPVSEAGLKSYSALGGFNFFISESSEKKDAGWEFIQFMTAPEQQKERAIEGAYFPTLRGLYSDEEIRAEAPAIRFGEEAVASARPRPVSPYYGDISLEMSEQLNASLTGDISPEEAASNMGVSLQEIVDSG